ncbi:MAG: hypothetical protein RIT03_98 [Bacteroidota bacterium]|jgi:hypothetical protein
MKSVNLIALNFIRFGLLAVVCLGSSSLNAFCLLQNTPSTTVKITEPATAELLVLKVELVDSKKILRVSFNGNEGVDAEMNFYNTKNERVLTANFELIKSPYYASVDVTNLPTGTYTVHLNTQSGKHRASFQLN